ncbi:hypothetical protein ACH4OX_06440 [Streptomyces roseolus]|uniref:hypothetical protein n=1 Tax=Streptomyces roseolus TaxID=67358 RepID=UPI0037989E45
MNRGRPPAEPEALPNLDWLAYVTAGPLEALTRFAEGWVPETCQDPGMFAAAPWAVPGQLAVFYRPARHRPALFAVQNRLRLPRAWRAKNGGLIAFGDESQAVFTWLFDPSRPDPDVWIDQDGYEPRREHQRLSGFLLRFALYEAMMKGPTTRRRWPGSARRRRTSSPARGTAAKTAGEHAWWPSPGPWRVSCG